MKLKEFLDIIKANSDGLDKTYFSFEITMIAHKVRETTGHYRNDIINAPPPAPSSLIIEDKPIESMT
jgi:hypothetical protein